MGDLWLSSALGVSPRTARPPTLRSIAHLLQRSQQLHRLWCPPPCQRGHQPLTPQPCQQVLRQRHATAYRSTRTAPWLSSAHDVSRRTARPPTLPSTAQCCIRTIKSHCNSRRPRRARKRRRRSLSSPGATALRSTRTDLWLSSALGVSPRTARPPTLPSTAQCCIRTIK